MLKDIFLIDARVGPSYNFRSVSEATGEVDPGVEDVDGFGLRIGIALGIAF